MPAHAKSSMESFDWTYITGMQPCDNCIILSFWLIPIASACSLLKQMSKFWLKCIYAESYLAAVKQYNNSSLI